MLHSLVAPALQNSATLLVLLSVMQFSQTGETVPLKEEQSEAAAESATYFSIRGL